MGTGRSDDGFTLIELLVVMIIIAILMAVAVPTYLNQKRNAMATRAKQDLKMLVATIESCAVSNLDGSINGALNCMDADVLRTQEPILDQLGADFWSGNGGGVLPAPGQLVVADLSLGWGGRSGYSVRTAYIDARAANGRMTFWEHHFPDGRVERGCSPAGVSPCTGSW